MTAYSAKAQPYLDAIAAGVFSSQAVRDWVVSGTSAEAAYRGADVLVEEQRAQRWRIKETTQPFWANYWCGRDARCTCRLAGSRGLESDAIFFLRNHADRILAIHVEFKHPREAFQFGQPEAYPLRAACFVRTCAERPSMNLHHDWMTTIFCGADTLGDPRLQYFQRVITHEQAAAAIPGYPE